MIIPLIRKFDASMGMVAPRGRPSGPSALNAISTPLLQSLTPEMRSAVRGDDPT